MALSHAIARGVFEGLWRKTGEFKRTAKGVGRAPRFAWLAAVREEALFLVAPRAGGGRGGLAIRHRSSRGDALGGRARRAGPPLRRCGRDGLDRRAQRGRGARPRSRPRVRRRCLRPSCARPPDGRARRSEDVDRAQQVAETFDREVEEVAPGDRDVERGLAVRPALRVAIRPRLGRAHVEHRLSDRRSGRHGAALLGLRPLPQRLRDRVRIEDRERRLAEAARRVALEVDRRAAARAAHDLQLRAHAPELRGRERADELLFAQELEERRQAPVLAGAAPVREAAGLRQIVRQRERRAAARAAEPLGERPARLALARMDVAEQLDHRARRQLDALVAGRTRWRGTDSRDRGTAGRRRDSGARAWSSPARSSGRGSGGRRSQRPRAQFRQCVSSQHRVGARPERREHALGGGDATILRFLEQREAARVRMRKMHARGAALDAPACSAPHEAGPRAGHRVAVREHVERAHRLADLGVRAREVGEDALGPGLARGGEKAPARVGGRLVAKRPVVGEHRRPPARGEVLVRRDHVAERGAVVEDVVPGERRAVPVARRLLDGEIGDEPRRVVEGAQRLAEPRIDGRPERAPRTPPARPTRRAARRSRPTGPRPADTPRRARRAGAARRGGPAPRW